MAPLVPALREYIACQCTWLTNIVQWRAYIHYDGRTLSIYIHAIDLYLFPLNTLWDDITLETDRLICECPRSQKISLPHILFRRKILSQIENKVKSR